MAQMGSPRADDIYVIRPADAYFLITNEQPRSTARGNSTTQMSYKEIFSPWTAALRNTHGQLQNAALSGNWFPNYNTARSGPPPRRQVERNGASSVVKPNSST
eukprot:355645-Chlamydomonas_euryale.AAC.27